MSALLFNGKKPFCPAQEECNQHLAKGALKIVSVTENQSTTRTGQSESAMEAAMRAVDNYSDTFDDAMSNTL